MLPEVRSPRQTHGRHSVVQHIKGESVRGADRIFVRWRLWVWPFILVGSYWDFDTNEGELCSFYSIEHTAYSPHKRILPSAGGYPCRDELIFGRPGDDRSVYG